MKILLATNNPGKIEEYQELVKDNETLVFITPEDIGLSDFVPVENGHDFEENAYIKAKAFYSRTKIPSIADDSGLCVKHLKGRPGINSARYAGSNSTDNDNIKLLLNEMKDIKNRKAYFETVICYYDGVGFEYAHGRIDGTISNHIMGSQGFGYDPIFIPDGYEISFAEMNREKKNSISHRSKAMAEIKSKILDKL